MKEANRPDAASDNGEYHPVREYMLSASAHCARPVHGRCYKERLPRHRRSVQVTLPQNASAASDDRKPNRTPSKIRIFP